MSSRMTGVKKLRRTLRRAPDEITDDVRMAVRRGAEAVHADAVARAPIDEGDLVRSIEIRFGRDGLTAVVGPGARAVQLARRKAGTEFATRSPRLRLSRRNKDLLFQFFKGRWIEFGTKGNSRLNIPPQPARPFMGPAADLNKTFFKNEARVAVRRALDRLARGV